MSYGDVYQWTHQQMKSGRAPHGTFGHQAVALAEENKFIVIGGTNTNANANANANNELHVFDAETNDWSRPTLQGQIPPVLAGSAIVAKNSQIFLFGGQKENGK